MKSLGNEIYIQRGENWSMDFRVADANGDPLIVSNQIRNAYLAITVASKRYEQEGKYRKTWWLNLDNRYEYNKNTSTYELVPLKKFANTKALYIQGEVGVTEVLQQYPELSEGATNPLYDVRNQLYYVDRKHDGNREYYYLGEGDAVIPYDFRIVHAFDTREWVEQSYLIDVKLIGGCNVDAAIYQGLVGVGVTPDTNPDEVIWTNEVRKRWLNELKARGINTLAIDNAIAVGEPITKPYSVDTPLLLPTTLNVSSNLKGV